MAAELRPEKFGLSSYDGRWAEYFAESRFVRDRRAYLAVRCARNGADAYYLCIATPRSDRLGSSAQRKLLHAGTLIDLDFR